MGGVSQMCAHLFSISNQNWRRENALVPSQGLGCGLTRPGSPGREGGSTPAWGKDREVKQRTQVLIKGFWEK